jgi:hypothetical protein
VCYKAGSEGDGPVGIDSGLTGRSHQKAESFKWIAKVFKDVKGNFNDESAGAANNKQLVIKDRNRCCLEQGAETPTAQCNVSSSCKSAFVGRCFSKNF